MQVCVLDKNNANESFVTIDGAFIVNYMKLLNETQLKVYLLGLHLCSNPNSTENTLEYIKDTLLLSEDVIISNFLSLQELGLVTVSNQSPLQVIYHGPSSRASHRTFKKDKYTDFNIQLQSCFPDKMFLNMNDYNMCYEFIENNNIEPGVLINIAKHCVNQKGGKVALSYILKLASSWINEGIRSVDDVEARIMQMEQNSGQKLAIAQAIGKTTPISDEDKDLYIKWTESWGFDISAINAACRKSMKSFNKLDRILDECFTNGCIASVEVEGYLKNKKKIHDNSIQILQNLGLYLDNVYPVMNDYVSPWANLGYSFNSLIAISKYAFKNNIRSLQHLDVFIKDLYKKGIVSDEQITIYFEQLYKTDMIINEILSIIKLVRPVNNNDRGLFEVWTAEWNFSIEIIKYIASKNELKPFSDIGKTLSTLKTNNIYDIDKVKQFLESKKDSKGAKNFNANDKKYTEEELNNSFVEDNDIDKVEF